MQNFLKKNFYGSPNIKKIKILTSFKKTTFQSIKDIPISFKYTTQRSGSCLGQKSPRKYLLFFTKNKTVSYKPFNRSDKKTINLRVFQHLFLFSKLKIRFKKFLRRLKRNKRSSIWSLLGFRLLVSNRFRKKQRPGRALTLRYVKVYRWKLLKRKKWLRKRKLFYKKRGQRVFVKIRKFLKRKSRRRLFSRYSFKLRLA